MWQFDLRHMYGHWFPSSVGFVLGSRHGVGTAVEDRVTAAAKLLGRGIGGSADDWSASGSEAWSPKFPGGNGNIKKRRVIRVEILQGRPRPVILARLGDDYFESTEV